MMNELPFTGTTQRHRMPHAEIPGCALVQDLIPLYLDGEVTPESHVLMADHLQHCERCSGYLAGARTVRSQILHEQHTIRAASTNNPTITQVQQPVASSLPVMLWQSLMVVLYAAGLFSLFIAFADGELVPLVIGAPLVIGGLTGLIITGSVRTRGWYRLMQATSAIALWPSSVAIATWGRGSAEVLVYSACLVFLGAWGIWLHRTQQPSAQQSSAPPTQPLPKGAHQAMLTAVMMVLCSGMCLIAALGGLFLLVEAPEVEAKLIGVGLMVASSAGLLTLTERLGWQSEWINRQTLRNILGLALMGSGTLWSAFVLQHALGGAIPVLVLLAVGAIAVIVGYRLLQPTQS